MSDMTGLSNIIKQHIEFDEKHCESLMLIFGLVMTYLEACVTFAVANVGEISKNTEPSEPEQLHFSGPKTPVLIFLLLFYHKNNTY